MTLPLRKVVWSGVKRPISRYQSYFDATSEIACIISSVPCCQNCVSSNILGSIKVPFTHVEVAIEIV